MPGVPSSKACEACRKQKKRCDQKRPSCGRCKRVGVPCIGSGQQRYKFHNHTLDSDPVAGGELGDRQARGSSQPLLTVIPVSQSTQIASSLVSRLQVDDVKYDISCYGVFLAHLPQRIGTNKALDTSIDAFVTAYSNPPLSEDSAMLTKYGTALGALGASMNSPSKNLPAETLCAVYLLMLVQAWIGRKNDQAVDHVEGMYILLKNVKLDGTLDAIQTQIMYTMLVPVIYGSISNQNIKLGPWFWAILDKLVPLERLGPEPMPPASEKTARKLSTSLSLRSMARIPEFLREPEVHHMDILTLYHLCSGDIEFFYENMNAYKGLGGGPKVSGIRRRMYRNCQTGYGFAITMSLILNQILQALDPDNETFVKDATAYITRLIPLGEEGLDYWPIGSGHVPLLLTVAWGAASEPALRVQLMTLMSGFQGAFSACDSGFMAIWWKEKFEVMRRRLEVMRKGSGAAIERVPDSENITSSMECCLM